MAALRTLLAVVNLGRSSWWTPVNWGATGRRVLDPWITWRAVIKLRPDFAARPRRSSTAPATMCIVAACLAAVGSVVSLEVLVPDRTGADLAWFAVCLAVASGLSFHAHRLNDRAEANGRFSRTVDPEQPA